MKYQDMSKRAKEEYAAALLKFSYSLFLAFILTITIAPMGVILANIAAGNSGTAGWLAIANVVASWQGVLFVVLQCLAAYLSNRARNRAFEIYNELSYGE